MTWTPRTRELERQLRAAMTPQASDLVVDSGLAEATVARAVRARRRRRLVYAIGAPVAAAAVAAGIVTAVEHEVRPPTVPAVQTPGPTLGPEPDPSEPVDGPVSLGRWLENRSLDPAYLDKSEPAAPGTMMYRSCAEGDCTVTLVAPSGRQIDLADVHPDLASSLAADGLADVSLSPTGHWLGRPEDGGYRIYHLEEPGIVEEVAADTRGDRWELVGWSEQSWAPTLALYDEDKVVRFLTWDSLLTTGAECCDGWRPRQYRPRSVDVPDDVVTTPIIGSTRPGLVPVAEPTQPVDDELPRVATTAPPGDKWLVVRGLDRANRPGDIIETSSVEGGYGGTSFEQCVGADETLAGPEGRIHTWWVRGSRSVHADTLTVTTAVYSQDPSVSEPVAVVLWACHGGPWNSDRSGPFWNGIPEGGRLDLPTTDADETWTFLGMLPDGQVALTREADGTTTYVRLGDSGELTDMHEIPTGAEVVTPGGVTGN